MHKKSSLNGLSRLSSRRFDKKPDFRPQSLQQIFINNMQDDETGRTLTYCHTAIIKLTFVIWYDSCDINLTPKTHAQSCTHMVDLLEAYASGLCFPSLE